MMKLQLLGWAPDIDPATPGVIVDASACVATTDGIRPMQSPEILFSTVTAAYPRSFAAVSVGDSTAHIVCAAYSAGAATSSTCTLLEFSNALTTARGTYTASTFTDPVIFRFFDGEMFAAKKNSPLKYAARGSDFTAVTGAPEASLLETTRDFVIAFDTTSGYDWQTCAIGNSHDWTLSVSNQAVRGELFNKSGRIVATGLFRENLIAFTETQMWIGRYVGAPSVFEWEQVAKDIGCVGPEAVAETPYGICWMSQSDVHIFDGTAPRSLNTQGVRRTMFYETSNEWRKHSQLAWERKSGMLWIIAASDDAPVSDYWRKRQFSYHFESQKWMPGQSTVWISEINQLSAANYLFTAAGPVRDEMMGTAWAPGLLTVCAAQNVRVPTGTTSANFKTGFIGDPSTMTMVKSVRPTIVDRYEGGACTGTLYSQMKTMDSTAVTQVSPLTSDSDFKFRQQGRYHQIKVELQNEDCISGLDVDIVPMGKR